MNHQKVITRPNGKIVVASYSQWRNIKVADRRGLILQVHEEYKSLSPDARVHKHSGEHLFWKNYVPDDIPIITIDDTNDYPTWQTTDGFFSAPGLDCGGVPAFSHHTANAIANQFTDISDFEPLTAGMVVHWMALFKRRGLV